MGQINRRTWLYLNAIYKVALEVLLGKPIFRNTERFVLNTNVSLLFSSARDVKSVHGRISYFGQSCS